MKLLAFDTATEACTAALWQDGQVLERFERHSQHSEHLLASIDSLLLEAGASLAQLDAIAFGRGPGSFTGLRIGAGVAQGLAFAAGLTVVPVSSLAALAQGVVGDKVLVALDARMQQVYWGAFQRNAQGLMQAVQAELVAAPAAVPLPAGRDWIGAGSGWSVYAEALQQHLAGSLCGSLPDAVPLARHVAALGVAALARGEGLSAEQAVPLYVRDNVATKAGASGR